MSDFNDWQELADALNDVLSQIVRKTAFDGQANVQAEIQAQGLIDTGFMLNSVYTVTSEESTYGQASPRKEDAYLLPEIAKPEDKTEAWIGVGANYAIFPNYGTVHQPARPFFEPGIDKTAQSFEQAMEAFESLVKEKLS